jgi:pyruvate oxidase
MLVFGASFSNHTGITPKKPIVQVDFDPMTLGTVPPGRTARARRDRR